MTFNEECPPVVAVKEITIQIDLYNWWRCEYKSLCLREALRSNIAC